MLSMTLRLEGSRALLMRHHRLSNPHHEMTVALREARMQPKTDTTYAQMRRLEWFGGLVTDLKGRVALSEDMILAAGVDGAKFIGRERGVRAAVIGQDPFFALEYDGPSDIEALYNGGKHQDYRVVTHSEQRRSMRMRPRFDVWAVNVVLLVDETVLDPRDVVRAYETAGRLVGIGDFRPRFGRFTVELI